MEEENQVLKGIQAILQGRLDDGKDNGTGSGPGGGIGEEEVFSVDDKSFDGALARLLEFSRRPSSRYGWL